MKKDILFTQLSKAAEKILQERGLAAALGALKIIETQLEFRLVQQIKAIAENKKHKGGK